MYLQRLNNENMDSDRFTYVSRVKPRQLANYHQLKCPYENWVILLLIDFSAPGKHPSGGFTRADGRVRDRDQPEARAPIYERVHADALVWFSNLVAISNPPNGTWCPPSLARYSRICTKILINIQICNPFLTYFRTPFAAPCGVRTASLYIT